MAKAEAIPSNQRVPTTNVKSLKPSAITNSLRSPSIGAMLILRNQSITVSVATFSATNTTLAPSFFTLVVGIFIFCFNATRFGVLSKESPIYY
jgi:hypothetical protein